MNWIQTNPFVDATGRLVTASLRLINDISTRLLGLTSQYAVETSYPSDFTDPLISADALGNITIANHSRTYGDGKIVAVTGALFASAASPTDVLHVYYDDALRAGGAVAYAFTVAPTNPPIQGGARLVVGRVVIPAVGTANGTYLHPPGWLG